MDFPWGRGRRWYLIPDLGLKKQRKPSTIKTGVETRMVVNPGGLGLNED